MTRYQQIESSDTPLSMLELVRPASKINVLDNDEIALEYVERKNKAARAKHEAWPGKAKSHSQYGKDRSTFNSDSEDGHRGRRKHKLKSLEKCQSSSGVIVPLRGYRR